MLRSLTEAEQKLFGTLLPVENSRKKIALDQGKANVREKVSTIPICSFTVRRIPMPSSPGDRGRFLRLRGHSGRQCFALTCLPSKSPPSQIRQRSLVGAGAKIHWHTISLGAELSQNL